MVLCSQKYKECSVRYKDQARIYLYYAKRLLIVALLLDNLQED